MSLSRSFWIVAVANLLLGLVLMVQVATSVTSRYDGLVQLLLLGFLVLTVALAALVAWIDRPVAYGIGLALALLPPVAVGSQLMEGVVARLGGGAEAAAGAFAGRAERALAQAILAGDAGAAAAALAAANPNAVGRHGMTFLRLALSEGRADPAIVAALLRAGADPDQDHQMLFGSVNDGSVAESGAMITGRDEALLRAVLAAGVDLDQADPQGQPRFFSALRWPEGLALMLRHGADIEAADREGNTAIMVAVLLWHWPAIDVLLAQGARLDRVNQRGQSLRDIVLDRLDRYRRDGREAPPQLQALAARQG